MQTAFFFLLLIPGFALTYTEIYSIMSLTAEMELKWHERRAIQPELGRLSLSTYRIVRHSPAEMKPYGAKSGRPQLIYGK